MRYDDFMAALRTNILGVTAITDVVSSRVHFISVGTLQQIPYPAITFQMAEGRSFQDIVRDFPMTVNSHSDKHFDEASALHDILMGHLDGLLITPGAIVIRATSQPTQNYVIDPRLYTMSSGIHVWLI